MPSHIGQVEIPRRSPHFLRCRQTVRDLAGRSVVVGLSGGPDSLALAAACAAEGVEAEAVVVDHQLQSRSGEVAQQAVDQARMLGMSAQLRTATVSTSGDGMEADARRARYTALREAAEGRDILIAHTAEDQAETLLLAALRGNPTGMPPRAGQILRPLLTLRRADTVGACEELGLEYWADPQNDDRRFRRVAVRHEVMDLLAEITGADPVPALAMTAGKIAADNQALSELAGEPTDDCAELAAQPGPVRRRRITAWLHARDLSVTQATVAGVEKLCTHWRGQGGVAVGHRGGSRLAVHRVGGRLSVIPEDQERARHHA